jgi:hypothetical protein
LLIIIGLVRKRERERERGEKEEREERGEREGEITQKRARRRKKGNGGCKSFYMFKKSGVTWMKIQFQFISELILKFSCVS